MRSRSGSVKYFTETFLHGTGLCARYHIQFKPEVVIFSSLFFILKWNTKNIHAFRFSEFFLLKHYYMVPIFCTRDTRNGIPRIFMHAGSMIFPY